MYSSYKYLSIKEPSNPPPHKKPQQKPKQTNVKYELFYINVANSFLFIA